MMQDAWGWCTGMTQRDGMGREVGGGFRTGNTCTPVVDSRSCMAKSIQYCKVSKKNVIKNVVLVPGGFLVPTAVPEVVLNFLSLDFHVPVRCYLASSLLLSHLGFCSFGGQKTLNTLLYIIMKQLSK